MKYFLFSLFMFVGIATYGQVPYQLKFGGDNFNLEDTSNSKYFYIDSTIQNNQWQIGRPKKSIFSNAYSFEKAIITDTLNTYPVKNLSIFSMMLLRAEGFFTFNFYHKFNTDSLKDGGTIEISLDRGSTWGNVIDSSFLNNYAMKPYGSYNFYSKKDSI